MNTPTRHARLAAGGALAALALLWAGCDDAAPTAPELVEARSPVTPPSVVLSAEDGSALQALLEDPLVDVLIAHADAARVAGAVRPHVQALSQQIAAGDAYAVREALAHVRREVSLRSEDDARVSREALLFTLLLAQAVLDSATTPDTQPEND